MVDTNMVCAVSSVCIDRAPPWMFCLITLPHFSVAEEYVQPRVIETGGLSV